MYDFVKEFQWDSGNKDKNWCKHGIAWETCEEVFFNNLLLICEDLKHSAQESRWYALGQTNQEQKLFIVFTIRKEKIRIISARPMSKKERVIYEKTNG